jgi:hypothetical protein
MPCKPAEDRFAASPCDGQAAPARRALEVEQPQPEVRELLEWALEVRQPPRAPVPIQPLRQP